MATEPPKRTSIRDTKGQWTALMGVMVIATASMAAAFSPWFLALTALATAELWDMAYHCGYMDGESHAH